MSRLRCYVAGPMRGYPEHNIPAFRAAAEYLRALGLDVVSPIEVGEAWAGDGDQSAHPPEAWLREDIKALLTCNAIHLLDGWQASVGARCEAAVAVTLGFTVLNELGDPVDAPALIAIAGGYNRPPGAVDSLDLVFSDVQAWQAVTFPLASRHSVATHLLEEAHELAAKPDDDEESADVAMLLAGMMPTTQLIAAIRAKLAKCRLRVWGQPDADGVVRHVSEGQP